MLSRSKNSTNRDPTMQDGKMKIVSVKDFKSMQLVWSAFIFPRYPTLRHAIILASYPTQAELKNWFYYTHRPMSKKYLRQTKKN